MLQHSQLPIERYQHFGRDDPVPAKFGPKCNHPEQEGFAFHVSHAALCAVMDSRPSCSTLVHAFSFCYYLVVVLIKNIFLEFPTDPWTSLLAVNETGGRI